MYLTVVYKKHGEVRLAALQWERKRMYRIRGQFYVSGNLQTTPKGVRAEIRPETQVKRF